jgi:hypothetical protein
MTEEEQAALLKHRGHPFLMASRYLPQQQLIGPALFPYYRQALKFVVFWVVLPIALFGGAIHAIYSDAPTAMWGRAIGAAWNGGIYAVGIVTLVFAILEHERVRINVFDRWNPASLREPKPGRAVPRSETVVGLVAGLTFLVWWTGLISLPDFVFDAGNEVQIAAAPIWSELYVPILLSLVAGVTVHLVDLIRPWRTLAVSAVDVAINVVNLVIVSRLLRNGRYLIVSGAPEDAERVAVADGWFNQIIEWAFLVVCAIVIFHLCYEVWQMLKTRRQGAG